MPEKTTTTWTCSRCDRTLVLRKDGRIDQPTDWRRLRLTVPPRKDPNESNEHWDLCAKCKVELGRWLAGAELMPAEGLPIGQDIIGELIDAVTKAMRFVPASDPRYVELEQVIERYAQPVCEKEPNPFGLSADTAAAVDAELAEQARAAR